MCTASIHDGRDLESLPTWQAGLPRPAPQPRSGERSAFARRRCTGTRTGCASAGFRLRLVVPGHRSVRAAGRRLLHLASFLQRRHGRAATHSAPGPHPVRHPRPARTRRCGSTRPSSCAREAAWRVIDTHPDYLVDDRILNGLRPVPGPLRRRRHRLARAPARGQRMVAAPGRLLAASMTGGVGGWWAPPRGDARVRFLGGGLVSTARRHRHRRRLPGPRHRPQPRPSRDRCLRARRRAVDQSPLALRLRRAAGEGPPRRRHDRHGTDGDSRGGATFEGWVVYPTREETVAALSGHRTELSQHFRIPTPEWSIECWAWDKRNTYRRAAELGIPAPRTWLVSTRIRVGRDRRRSSRT